MSDYFLRLVRKLKTTGSLADKRGESVSPSINMLAVVVENPHVGTPKVALDSELSQRSVVRVLHKQKLLHPYNMILN